MKLQEKERELKLEPDFAIESYLKATSVEGKRQNAVTEFVMRILGLEVRYTLKRRKCFVGRALCRTDAHMDSKDMDSEHLMYPQKQVGTIHRAFQN